MPIFTGISNPADRQDGCFVSKRIFLLIRVALGVTLITGLFGFIDLRGVFASFTRIHTGLAVLLCLVSILERMLMACKWNLLLRARGILISMWQAMQLYFVGHLIGAFTPGGIGADAFRVTALSKFRKTGAVVSTIVLERFIGLTVRGVFAAITLPVSIQYLKPDSIAVVWIIIGGTVLTVVTLVLSLRPSFVQLIGRRIPYVPRTKIAKQFRDSYYIYAESRFHLRILFMFTLLTVVQILVQVYTGYLAAKSLDIRVSFGYMLCVMPLAQVIMRLPISIQGIGVLEGSLAYFLLAGGFSAEDGFSIALLLRAVGVVGSYLPAAVMWWVSPMRIQPSTNSLQKA